MVQPLRTWTISFDNAFSNQLDQAVQYREACFNTKAALTTAGWTVQLSSDSVSAGATDYWVDAGDIVYAADGSPHSWCVLRSPSGWIPGTDRIEILLNCNNATPDTTPQQMQAVLTTGTYSGGTASAIPTTAGLTTTVLTNGDDIIPWTTVQTGRWTSWSSSRGDVMFGVKIQGTLQWRYFFILTANVDANGGGQGAYRCAMFASTSTSANVLNETALNATTNWRGFNSGNTVAENNTIKAASTVWEASQWTNGLTDGGETVFTPIDLIADAAASGRMLGSLVDLYGTPGNLASGTLDDAETAQTQRRYCFGQVTAGGVAVYVPTASLPFL